MFSYFKYTFLNNYSCIIMTEPFTILDGQFYARKIVIFTCYIKILNSTGNKYLIDIDIVLLVTLFQNSIIFSFNSFLLSCKFNHLW